jgi:hypothetical protein
VSELAALQQIGSRTLSQCGSGLNRLSDPDHSSSSLETCKMRQKRIKMHQKTPKSGRIDPSKYKHLNHLRCDAWL